MFVAVIPPEVVLDELEEFVGPRREVSPFRWTRPEQWHLTLAFAEHIPDRAYDELLMRLAGAARKRRSVEARIAGAMRMSWLRLWKRILVQPVLRTASASALI